MKRLTVLRHAQAVQSGEQDFARGLTPHGEAQAVRAVALLVAQQLQPDLILASTALRTRATAQSLVSGGLGTSRLLHDERLYLASYATLLAVIRETDASVSHLLLVGHNPGASELCRALRHDGERAELGTAAFCSLQLPITAWDQLPSVTTR